MGGWVAGKAGLRIAYSNQKLEEHFFKLKQIIFSNFSERIVGFKFNDFFGNIFRID
jgi:hypothetical protein